MVPECKPEWNREAITVFSRLPSLMAADKPCPQLQPSLTCTAYFFHRAPIDEGYKKEVVIDHNIVTADGLAVDWLYSHLYWTDTGTNSICMSDLDGNLVTTIITDHLEEPRAIALHPSKG